jgi:PAS domain S-box-containing protein
MTKGQRTALLEVIAGLSLIVATSIGASSILNRIDRKLHNTAQLNAAEAEESYTTIRNLVVLLFGVTGVLATALYAAVIVARRRSVAQLEREIRARTLALARDRQQIEMLAHALRSVSECVVVTDMANTILFINDAFVRTYGYAAGELIGGNIDIVRSSQNPRSLIDRILPATLAGGWSGEVLNRRRGGEDFPVFLSTSVVRNEKNEPIALIGVAVDITARKRQERQLVEAREAAEAAARTKSQFLAAMSHEIRTPMNGVIGMTELLLNTTLTPEQRDFVETIHVSGENLLTIINDILDFSKIDSGKIELELSPFDVRAAVEEVLKLLTTKADEKGLEVAYRVESKVPTYIEGDETRFKQVLINLVGNAIKFTHRGQVTVYVVTRNVTRDGNFELVCEVSDTGIGIPADKLDRLFKAFSQVDSSTNRRFGGTGLGLAICHGLVELMGGRIEVHSILGHGSTFRFSIKAREAVPDMIVDAPAALAAHDGRTQTTSKTAIVVDHEERRSEISVPKLDAGLSTRLPLKILVAEDNPVNQKLVQLVLARMGYKADLVENGLKAVLAVELSPYDILFMDLHMPEMDGLQATARIRRTIHPDRQPRIIAMTADALVGDREKCINAGMDDYVGKPIRSEEVQVMIERWGTLRTNPKA